MTQDFVWMSRAFTNPSRIKYTRTFGGRPRETRKLEIASGYAPLVEDIWTKKVLSRSDDPHPCIFTSGGIYIDELTMETLLQFDLGNTTYAKMDFRWSDTMEPVETAFYTIFPGNPRLTIDFEQCSIKKIAFPGTDLPQKSITLSIKPKPGEVFALPEATTDGPDIWRDPHLFGGDFFLSDRLVKALKKAKRASRFDLCKIPFHSDGSLK